MLRFLLFFCALWIFAGVSGQENTIKKSSDVVVIKGKSYYLHTVEAGQTLFSISKAYGVDVNELRMLNYKKDNSLSLYEVLKVPYVEPFVQKDNTYYYHKVKKGETLYSISRQFDIKPRRILKFNEQYSHNEPLSIGAVVRLPLDEIDRSALERVEKQNRIAVTPKKEEAQIAKADKPVVADEGKVKPEEKKKNEIKEDIRKKDAGKEANEVLVINSGEKQPEGMPSFISDVVMVGDPYVKVALLLPFYAREYPTVSDSLNTSLYTSLTSRSEQFVYFYEGILLAVDSLKNKGYKVDLHVYDTEKNAEKMYTIADELNRLKPDLIIGPVYGSVFKTLNENLEDKNVPMVYPLSSRSESCGQYPNFIQVNASFATLARKMTEWIGRQTQNANVIQVELADAENDEDRRMFVSKMKELENVLFFKWELGGDPLGKLKPLLLPDRENIIVLPTTREADVSKVLPVLSAYADSYKITVVGFPEWQTFTSVDHETYFKLNTKLFTYSYVDNSTPAANDFAVKFRKYFYTEPNSLAFKAYDLGLYFVELAARYRDRTLEAIDYYHKDGVFSRFGFSKMPKGYGKENQAFYIVNFGSDYQLKIEAL